MRPEERLKTSRQFQEVYLRGRRFTGPHLTIFFLPNKLGLIRLGLSLSKKRFKLSVRRHYLARRLREAFRLNKNRFRPGFDIVLSAYRFERKKIKLRQIEQEMLALAEKAHLIKKHEKNHTSSH
ncbi:ribonuclease P protein component [Candidatus Omnitrophota bacterium]